MATEKSENQVFWAFGEAYLVVEPVRHEVRYVHSKTVSHEGLTTKEGLSLDTTEATLGIVPEL